MRVVSNFSAKPILRRKIYLYYKRAILLIKLSITLFIIIFFTTDIFSSVRDRVKQDMHNFFAENGVILHNLTIHGQENSSIEDIINCLDADNGTPTLSVDISKIQKKIKKISWIDEVIVERNLPSTIRITILERKANAIWQFNKKLYLIDSEGEIITDYQKGFEDLLHVVGEDANIHAERLINDISIYPDLANKIQSAVRYGKRRWNLNLIQNIKVKMPEKDIHFGLEYLMLFDKHNKLFDQGHEVLDLRNGSKIFSKNHKTDTE